MRSHPVRGARTVALLLAAAGTLLAGCSSDDSSSGAAEPAGDGFPVTIEHALGETVVPAEPERIVTLGWASQDVVAALGKVPVGVRDFSWGEVDTYLPWFEEKVEELGGELPEVISIDDADVADAEQILALEPDLIVATHSGISDAEYERLSTIAPTIGYADKPWASDWKEATVTIGTALGKADEARGLATETERLIDDTAGAHPEFQDVTFTYGWYLPEGEASLDFYVEADPRVQLMEQLGFTLSPQITGLTTEGDDFVTPVSLEELGTIESELHIGWVNSPEDITRTVEDPLVSQWGPVAAGSYYFVDGEALAWATNAPTVLGLPWALAPFADDLSEVLAGNG